MPATPFFLMSSFLLNHMHIQFLNTTFLQSFRQFIMNLLQLRFFFWIGIQSDLQNLTLYIDLRNTIFQGIAGIWQDIVLQYVLHSFFVHLLGRRKNRFKRRKPRHRLLQKCRSTSESLSLTGF